MIEDRTTKDRKTLARLVQRHGASWVIDNTKKIESEPPASPIGRRPHYRFNIASVWACVEFRRKKYSETIIEACDALHSVMKKHHVGFKLKPGRLKGMYHDASKNRRHEPALAEMMELGLDAVRSTVREVERVSDDIVFFPALLDVDDELPPTVMISTLHNLRTKSSEIR